MIPLLAALLLLAPQTDNNRLSWVPNPRRASGGWVADPGHHLSATAVDRINAIAAELERSSTAEIAVVVLDSLDGLEPSAAALLLHRRWGVGKANRDNGIVLLWAPGMRQIFVSVGYGLEGVLPDAKAGRIQRETMIPAFRSNDFDNGMIAGVEALAAAAREETYAGMQRNQAARPARDMSRRGGAFPWWFAFPALGFIGLGVGGTVGWRYRPRRCRNGHGWMRRLSESEDDAFIGAEGVLEETLGSMNYDVWACPSCEERRVYPHRKIFSRYSACPRCTRRTLETRKKTLIAATYSHGGEREVTRTCRNRGCGYEKVTIEAIPMLQASSSSSGGGGGGGGGGSDFGGGSSGGGGAGSSY